MYNIKIYPTMQLMLCIGNMIHLFVIDYLDNNFLKELKYLDR